jgi:hypothetical protein
LALPSAFVMALAIPDCSSVPDMEQLPVQSCDHRRFPAVIPAT